MKTFVNILFGIFVGITISSYFVLRNQDSRSATVTTTLAKTQTAQKIDNQRKPVPRPQVIPKPIVKEAPAAKPKVLDLTINEHVVEELEKNWDELRSQIQVSTEARGFRVKYLSDKSPFLQAGLQTGDLVPFETLRAMQDSNPEEKQLAERVVRIFEHVR
jgi:hypothetical protein